MILILLAAATATRSPARIQGSAVIIKSFTSLSPKKCRAVPWISRNGSASKRLARLLYFYTAEQSTVSDADQVLLPAFRTIEQKVLKDRVPTEPHSGFPAAGRTKHPARFVIAHPKYLPFQKTAAAKEACRPLLPSPEESPGRPDRSSQPPEPGQSLPPT